MPANFISCQQNHIFTHSNAEDLQMLKKEARKLYRDKRKAISNSQREKWDDLILVQFQKLNLPFVETLFSYVAMESHNEIDPSNIIRFLKFTNPELIVAYPVCNLNDHTMKAIIARDDEFTLNQLGIPEPCSNQELTAQDIDLIIVPLLCFDKEGYRVGYGKGFYDKFLTGCNDDVIKIGLSYFDPVDKIGDREEFDVPLNYCVTPYQIYDF